VKLVSNMGLTGVDLLLQCQLHHVMSWPILLACNFLCCKHGRQGLYQVSTWISFT